MRARSHAKVYFLPDRMRNGRRRNPSVLTKVDFAIIAQPLRWVTVAGVDIRKRDGEVNVVEIEVVKTPVAELFLRQRLDLYLELCSVRESLVVQKPHMIMGMECVPELKVNIAQMSRDSEPRRWVPWR